MSLMTWHGKYVHDITDADVVAMPSFALIGLYYEVGTFSRSVSEDWLTEAQKADIDRLMNALCREMTRRTLEKSGS